MSETRRVINNNRRLAGIIAVQNYDTFEHATTNVTEAFAWVKMQKLQIQPPICKNCPNVQTIRYKSPDHCDGYRYKC